MKSSQKENIEMRRLNKEMAFDELIRFSVATGLANANLYNSNQCEKENIEKMYSRIEVKRLKKY